MFSNNSNLEDGNKDVENQQNLGDFYGYCDILATKFSVLYNKNIIFWPCPKMKVSVFYN
jgi:hypothetical protein